MQGLDNRNLKKEASPIHDIHDFVKSSQRDIQEEYARIQRRAAEDPGTAGDQGEENWASLLRLWLPSYFRIVTKGRIITESGYLSPQVDLLVLMPSYPAILRDKKHYLAEGIAAAFECKTTLRAKHIEEAVRTCAELRRHQHKREGSPYKELNSSIIFGLLAHSHTWKGKRSKPLENIEKTLWEADSEFVRHPNEMLDFLCVSDLATWTTWKMNLLHPKHFRTPELAAMYAGHATTGYLCHAIGADRQEEDFSPLGVLLSGLFSKLAWNFPDMRNLEGYFRRVNMRGAGQGRSRSWDISIYSDQTKPRILDGGLIERAFFDEWSVSFI